MEKEQKDTEEGNEGWEGKKKRGRKRKERDRSREGNREEERGRKEKALMADRQEKTKRRLQGGDIKEIAYKALTGVQQF